MRDDARVPRLRDSLLSAALFTALGLGGGVHAQGNPDADASVPPGMTVLFEDGFETGDLSRWDHADADKYAVTDDPARVKSGRYALEASAGPTGELNKWFMPGHDELTVEFDVMFEEGFDNLRADGHGMHFFAVLGNRIDNRWSAHGQAGIRPNGNDFFLTALDPHHTFRDPELRPFFLYTYFPDMSCSVLCYGNVFEQSEPAVHLDEGRWYRIRVRLKANTPGRADGSQELWIDGLRKIEVRGLRWRDTLDVRVNEVAVWSYMPGTPRNQYIWIDNLVVWRNADTR